MTRTLRLSDLAPLTVFLVRSWNGGDWRLALWLKCEGRSWVVR